MKQQQVTELLAALVAVPSVNNAHAGRDEDKGELRVSELAGNLLADLGAEVEYRMVEAGRPNLIARFNRGAHKRLLIEGHLDTVSVVGMTIPPFVPRIEGGKLFGRGSCDTKGPVAAALAAMTGDRMSRAGDAGWEIVFAGAMGEESGNEGAFALVADGDMAADHALVLEPTCLQVVRAHKGCRWIRIDLEGAGAHGSNPAAGINAIEPMADLIALVRELRAEFDRFEPHPLLGRPTVNIGKISGGSAVNIVAPSASISLDIRFLPDQDTMAVTRRLESLLTELRADRRLVGFSLHHTVTEAFENAGRSLLAGLLCDVGKRLGSSVKDAGSSWFSDAGPLSQCCSDTVVFGPGDIAQAHTNDEFIRVNELQKGCEIIGSLLERLTMLEGDSAVCDR